MRNQWTHWAALISAWFILALFAEATLTGDRFLWGFNLGAFLPTGVAGVGLAFGLLLMWRQLALKGQTLLDGLSFRVSSDKWLRVIVPVILALGFGALFLVFQSSSSLLGDAILRLNQIEDGRLFLPTEMGDFFVHAILGQLYFIPNEIDIERCYNFVSVISGLFFIFGTWRLATYLRPHQSIQLFLVLIGSGMKVLFFG